MYESVCVRVHPCLYECVGVCVCMDVFVGTFLCLCVGRGHVEMRGGCCCFMLAGLQVDGGCMHIDQ